MSAFVFEDDVFDIKDVDKDGKPFEKVSRIECKSENYETDMTLDINCEIFPVEIGEKFSFALASTLNADGSPDDGFYNPQASESIADKYHYDYVMHGKVFKIEPSKQQNRLTVYASFGGLLLRLEGEPRNLHDIKLDERIYLLIRRTQ